MGTLKKKDTKFTGRKAPRWQVKRSVQIFIDNEMMKNLISSVHFKGTLAATWIFISTFSHAKMEKGYAQYL